MDKTAQVRRRAVKARDVATSIVTFQLAYSEIMQCARAAIGMVEVEVRASSAPSVQPTLSYIHKYVCTWGGSTRLHMSRESCWQLH